MSGRGRGRGRGAGGRGRGRGGNADAKKKKKDMKLQWKEGTQDNAPKKGKTFQLGGKTPPVERQHSVYPTQNVNVDMDEEDQQSMMASLARLEERRNALKAQVLETINAAKLMNSNKVLSFITRFFDELGIDEGYFRVMNADLISAHIHSIYAYKTLKHAKQSDKHIDDLYLKQNYGDDLAIYSTRSNPSAERLSCVPVEREIETKYLLEGYVDDPQYDRLKSQMKERPWRIECYSTDHPVEEDDGDFNFPLRFYMIRRPEYVQGVVGGSDDEKAVATEEKVDSEAMADVNWLETVQGRTKAAYFAVAEEARTKMYPVVRIAERAATPHEKKIIIGYRHGTTHSLFSSLTDLYHSVGLTTSKKFVEQFADGITIICLWVQPLTYVESGELDQVEFSECMSSFMHDLGTLFAMPRHKISMMFELESMSGGENNILTVREAAFLACAWQFAHQFLNQYGEEYQALLASISKHDVSSLGYLYKLKANLRQDTFTPDRVISAFKHHAMFGKILYSEFRGRHHPRLCQAMTELPDLSHLDEMARKNAPTLIDYEIFSACVSFLKHIVRTNFFKREKMAISFRLDPGFIDEREYPLRPFGVYFIVGAFFCGFHVRFSDIARGGIRLIRSRTKQAYDHNIGTVFNENYNLASTQFRKNKDIPEGGSKGTVILDYGVPFEMGEVNFRKYIDAILDLLVLPSDQILDHMNGRDEILFMGPDEGTAELMGWACQRARERGYPYWKAFTTGKPPAMGGIPHDVPGMTTRGVHRYVLNVIEKLGLNEAELTKCQTGGPDGDLGSNEVLQSLDKTVVVIDGSGTLYDPAGIDKEELRRLARRREMIDKFDMTKLGSSASGAFRVLCTEPGEDEGAIILPHGERVESGLMFRNTFHTHPLFRSDFFVPCGGRPKAINLNNVSSLFDDDGNGACHFKFIIEGANLFFTDEARAYCEERGVIMFKDASANKGGVTSSSLEVLAALAMDDEQHATHMCVADPENVPAFYDEYVAQVIEIIERNANDEFRCIWEENERSGTRRVVLTDALSNRINDLNVELVNSRLWNRKKLREFVILDAIPKCLVNLIGKEQIFERVPEAYLKAIFGAHFASMFVYEKGLNTSPFSFTDFLEGINEQIGEFVE